MVKILSISLQRIPNGSAPKDSKSGRFRQTKNRAGGASASGAREAGHAVRRCQTGGKRAAVTVKSIGESMGRRRFSCPMHKGGQVCLPQPEEREERREEREERECEALRAAARLRLQKQAATPKSLMSVGSSLRRLRSVRVRFPRRPRTINNKHK